MVVLILFSIQIILSLLLFVITISTNLECSMNGEEMFSQFKCKYLWEVFMFDFFLFTQTLA